jgi:Tfp pilus assembly protein FimT
MNTQKGYTLVELLIVIAALTVAIVVIAIVAVIGFAVYKAVTG